MREIWALQPRFERRSAGAAQRLLEHLRFRAGYDFMILRCDAGEAPAELGAWWTRFVDAEAETRQQLIDEAPSGGAPRKRRRRRPSGRKAEARRVGAAAAGRLMDSAPAAGEVRAARAFVGLGANLGEPGRAIAGAIRAIAALPGTRLVAVSSLYRSAPVDAAGPDFLNAVAQFSTSLEPHALLRELQAIEQGQGRERPYRNAPRTLDLDLLLYDDLVLAGPCWSCRTRACIRARSCCVRSPSSTRRCASRGATPSTSCCASARASASRSCASPEALLGESLAEPEFVTARS